ncbi:MAG: TetR/AcrR family transcriptional regulator [Cytophagales bacterium]|jgi:AcrR family transcriptional regulator|nr:TetR/AcrR family transcriptional regulator [Cytophagales bacterium]
MGVTERKAREKEELRSLILEAAMRLFAEKGVENVTIRNIADAVEYSIGTIYVYFKDKNAILHALHTKGFAELRSRFLVLMHVNNPMERLKAAGHVYIQFAHENPEMYNLMFSIIAPMDFIETWNNEWNEGQATFSFVRDMVQDCMKIGYFGGHSALPLAYMIWSMVHGMCSLVISRRASITGLENPPAEAYAEFLRILDKL